MATLTDVAKVARVGIMSVSRVVNGTRNVSAETEQKVRLAIARIGYEPNEAARILTGQRSSVLGLIVPDLADSFFATCANAVQETARQSGYLTWMAASSHREDVERDLTRVMMQRHVAGLLVIPSGSQNDFEQAAKSTVFIVSLDRPLEHVQADALVVDNRAAAAKATEHPIGHGHKSILCITDDERIFTKVERVTGYSKAMRRAKLPVQICSVGPLSGNLSDQLDFIMKASAPPTAIFAESNLRAVETLHELRKRSLNIPTKMALIAFDDFDAATLVSPTITAVKQPIAELGRQAAELICARLDGSRSGDPARITLKTKLVIRQSCGCKG